MALFGRRKKAEAQDEEAVEASSASGDAAESLADAPADSLSSAETAVDDGEEERAARRARSKLRPRDDVDRSHGPFDVTEVEGEERLDFGSLLITPIDGVELRLDVDENSQVITGLTALFGENNEAAVQLQAFAAPKTSGIWYGIRREIADSLIAGGGKAEEVEGPLGTQLNVSMPSQGPDGRATFAPARFVGVDGPRWFLRAVLSGQAALDEASEAQAMDIVRAVAVRRGGEPRAPRELLELTLPPELLAQANAQAEQVEQASDQDTAKIERLERGPEITEVR